MQDRVEVNGVMIVATPRNSRVISHRALSVQPALAHSADRYIGEPSSIAVRSNRVSPRVSPSKFRQVERWVARRLDGVAHERRVALIASALFDLTLPLHGLSPAHRRLLRLAALVHDVGRRFGERNHPVDGSRMIRQAKRLPLSGRERRALAYLTRYHRGAVPKIGFDDLLRPGDGRRSLRLLLALLRAADTLDNRQIEAPPTIRVARRGRRLQIVCETVDVSHHARARKTFRRRKKYRLLAEMLGLKIEVDVKRA